MKKIVRKIIKIAKKAAYQSVGKSIPWGVHEIKPPAELLSQKKCDK